MKIALLTGGSDRPYAFGLLGALVAKGIEIDFIGSDEFTEEEVLIDPGVQFLNLRGNTDPNVPAVQKITRITRYYFRLLQYTARSDSPVFHILWANRFPLLDRVLLSGFYKLFGKRLVFTAHNVNEGQRDGKDSLYNRLTLKALYALVDYIFVHTKNMREQLTREFGVDQRKISVIPFGINNTMPKSKLTESEARKILDLREDHKVMLFFGRIAPYKGLDTAIDALSRLVQYDDRYRLVVAGRIEKGCQGYWEEMEASISRLGLEPYVIKRTDFIPEAEVEIFLKSADVSLLPYKSIFQSGVLFLAYSFGLPVIATDVGSFKEDIVEGRTGLVCRADDAVDLGEKIQAYFQSSLFANLQAARADIMAYGNKKYSWSEVGDITSRVYASLLGHQKLSEPANTQN